MQSIKKRVRGVTNTSKITKAMEMVSAQKMRRSQEIALASRPYALRGLELLAELSRRVEKRPDLMTMRETKRTLILLVAADKGLAGSFNSQVFRRVEEMFGRALASLEPGLGSPVFAAVGRKAEDFLRRKGLAVHQAFVNFGDYVDLEEVDPLSDFVIRGYEREEWDRVITVSTHFRTTLRQEVLVREVLPATFESIEKTVKEIIPERGRYANMPMNGYLTSHPNFDYLIEPSPLIVLDVLVRHLVTMSIYHLVLEANASEHSARMVAMKNASDNAGELIDSLTLEYNKARQAAITKELAEITGGAEALRG